MNADCQGCSVARGELRDVANVDVLMGAAFDPVFGEAWSKTQLSGMLITPGSWLLLLRLEDKLAGFAIGRSTLDETELMLLAISPDYRRRGLGRKLLNAVIAEARSRDAQRLFLEMRSDNETALGLYNDAGFIEVGRRSRYYRGSDGILRDAITMVLSLRG